MKTKIILVAIFLITFLLNIIFWKQYVHEDISILYQYYAYLALLILFIITLVQIILKLAPEYLGFSFLGIIFLKFLLFYMIIKKLNFNSIPYATGQIVVTYFMTIIIILGSTISQLKKIEEKKNED